LGKLRFAWVLRLLAADVATLLVAFGTAYSIRVSLDAPLGRAAGPLGYYAWLLGLIVPVWIGLLALLGGYGIVWTTRSRARLVVVVSALGVLILTAALFLVKESEVNRSLLLLFAGTSGAGLWIERNLVRAWLRRVQGADRWARVALVVGTDHRAESVIQALRRYPEVRWVVRGCLGLDPAEPWHAVLGVPVVGSLPDLPDLLQGDRVVDEVFFAVPADRLDQIGDALETCESLGVDTRVLVDFYRPAHAHPFVEELFALPFYGFSPSLTRQGAFFVKRIVDVAVASLLLVATAPLALVVALLIRMTSRGPIIFRQERAGFHGRRFLMYKFRTMVPGAEQMRDRVLHLNEMTGPVFKASDDPRLTPVGRLLRRASLDELPQLVNVVRGDMSLVGPRPLPLYEASRIKGAQRRRLAVRPGITGLWQVSGRNMVDFEEWMQMDLLYVDQWSLLLDLRTLLRTIPTVLSGKGAT
jgi:exopolysaccharide biosynthesis polyprenyl glycosylphosphotransferase